MKRLEEFLLYLFSPTMGMRLGEASADTIAFQVDPRAMGSTRDCSLIGSLWVRRFLLRRSSSFELLRAS